MRNRLKKWVSKENIITLSYVLLLTVLTVLFRAGDKMLPDSKWLREATPIWLVILGAVIGFASITLLIQKKNLFIKDYILGLTGIVLSVNVLSIGYKRFPSIFIITLFAVIFSNWGLIKIRLKIKKKESARRIKGNEGSP